jgi:hypothetical protein
VSREDPNVITAVLKQIEGRYGRQMPLTVTRGKKHDYLGMILDYSVDGKVKILMVDYIKKSWKSYPRT